MDKTEKLCAISSIVFCALGAWIAYEGTSSHYQKLPPKAFSCPDMPKTSIYHPDGTVECVYLGDSTYGRVLKRQVFVPKIESGSVASSVK